MTTVVIFGAGASAFSGSTTFDGQNGRVSLCPPLGNGSNGLFARLEAENGIAQTFRQDLQEILRSDFERGMRQMEGARSDKLVALQRQIANHLARYEIEDENLYNQLIRNLGATTKSVSWCSLNYDMLLEQAIIKNNMHVAYGLESEESSHVQVIKPHGSCNFLPDIRNNIIRNNLFFDCDLGYAGVSGNFSLNYAKTYSEIQEWCVSEINAEFSPVIAYYAKGKPFHTSFRQIDSLQRRFSRSILQSTQIIVIGVRFVPHDTHIWEPLRASSARISIVNPIADDILWWGKGRTGLTEHLSTSFQDVGEIARTIRTSLAN